VEADMIEPVQVFWAPAGGVDAVAGCPGVGGRRDRALGLAVGVLHQRAGLSRDAGRDRAETAVAPAFPEQAADRLVGCDAAVGRHCLADPRHQLGGSVCAWISPPIIALALAAVILLAALLVVERRVANPLCRCACSAIR
jgi:hypothetical protein